MGETEQRLGVYEFDNFKLDIVERTLWRRQKRIPLGGRAFDVLAALVRQAGRLITKEELLQQAWKGRVVEEGNIHVQISTLRRLLGDKAISTVSGHGYRFELPIGTAGAMPSNESNLPAALTPVVAREREVSELLDLLSERRLITIKGMGGIGKSSISVETCRRLQQSNPALRCWHVPVAASETGDGLQATILHAVDRRPKSGKAIEESLFPVLREKPTLLLLDGCEMVADTAARIIRRMLEQCPELKILCTSRKSLGLVGEAVFEVPPLPLDGARKLFLERAASASRSFDPGTIDPKALDRILKRLDGIPLAIELAASRLRAVGLKDLEQQLADRLGTLVASDRSLPDRQSTLRATLEWSYRLLSDQEKKFLNRVSIFEAPFTAEAAAYVGLGPTAPVGQAIDLITALIDKSFVTPEAPQQVGYYQILDSVREYGLGEIGKAEERGVRALCTKYFLKYVSKAVQRQAHSDWLTNFLPALRASWPDISASLHFSLVSDKTYSDVGAQLASRLIYFWVDEGLIDEAGSWLELASKKTALSDETRLALSHALGCAYAEKGLTVKASEKLLYAVSGYRELGGHIQELAISANELGVNLFGLLDYRGAQENYELAVGLNRRLGNVAREGQALQNLAVLEFASGRIDSAEQSLLKAIQLHKQAGNVRSESTSTIWLAECKFMRQEYLDALGLLDHARALRSPIIADVPSASIAFRVARNSAMLGRFHAAGRSALEALAILEPIGNPRALLECLDAIAVVALAMKQTEKFSSLNTAVESWRDDSRLLRSPAWQQYFSDLKRNSGYQARTTPAKHSLGDGGVGQLAVSIAKDIASFASTLPTTNLQTSTPPA